MNLWRWGKAIGVTVLILSLLGCVNDKAFEDGYAAAARGDYTTAYRLWKPLAEQGGIGWQGKHSNLVSRTFGSWLFLGEIFTSLDLPPDPPETDHCRHADESQDHEDAPREGEAGEGRANQDQHRHQQGTLDGVGGFQDSVGKDRSVDHHSAGRCRCRRGRSPRWAR